MSEPNTPDEFHDRVSIPVIEPLGKLVDRLGRPPRVVIQSWQDDSCIPLPEDFRDWDLDRLGVTANATLVRLDHGVSASVDPALAATPLASHAAAETVDVNLGLETHAASSVEPILNAAVIEPLARSAATTVTKCRPRHAGKLLVLTGLAAATIGFVFWESRPLSEPIVDPPDEANAISQHESGPDNFEMSNRRAIQPKTEPVESLGMIESSADVSSDEYSTDSLSAPTIDPAMFALESLLPSIRTDESLGTSATQRSHDANPTPPPSMDDVLAAGDDDPPPETPQPVRELARPVVSQVIAGSPVKVAETDETAESMATVQADPLAITFDVADHQPSWDLHQPIPSSGVHLSVLLDLPDGINQGWIEPLDEASPRRSRGIAVLTPIDEESVAIGLRMDVRCGAKLSIRIRVAARLDPTLPWQPFTRDALLSSADYFGQQSLLASTHAAQLESTYSKSDTYGRRVLRDQRDFANARVENFKLILKRIGELDSLAEKIESGGFVTVKLIAKTHDGEHTILETVAPEKLSDEPS